MNLIINVRKKQIKFKEFKRYISSDEICVFMIGSKISMERGLRETMNVKQKYKLYHDYFRQQLPLPILLKAIELQKSLKIFLIDPEFLEKPTIIRKVPILHELDTKKDKTITFYEPISLYLLKDKLFKSNDKSSSSSSSSMRKKRGGYPFIDLKMIVVSDVINYDSCIDEVKELDNLYYLYMGTLDILDDAIISNDTKMFVKSLLEWHNS